MATDAKIESKNPDKKNFLIHKKVTPMQIRHIAKALPVQNRSNYKHKRPTDLYTLLANSSKYNIMHDK